MDIQALGSISGSQASAIFMSANWLFTKLEEAKEELGMNKEPEKKKGLFGFLKE